MLNRSAEPEAYAEDVDKIEIDLPDDLLRQIDEAADRAGLSREKFVLCGIEAELARNRAEFKEKFEEMLGPPISLGGDSAEIIREIRDNWPPLDRGKPDE